MADRPAAQGAEERVRTMQICERPYCNGWPSCGHGSRRIEVVPLSRAQEAEAERESVKRKNRDLSSALKGAGIDRESHKRRADSLAARLEAVEGAVDAADERPLAELVEGGSDPEAHFWVLANAVSQIRAALNPSDSDA